ncbi:hypothetical protein M427DRAFT_52151 [Gonapodya prolifera JEL478]|uniref:N-terminal of MaoC-like dehydratase domain-containing protein n=1 Tax=Gonapodya prolifera (strain JEL478) TaxID=1344416 RepID=A0A139AVQ6_GONPJ|nr:hypothetical protein M427DRAFT_52151 [Gonapodya prolifera JEL478]|eukprot:KXS20555.1 hypothetical protein M427DRAFT_52151 [Gonapodya prolifera JEL478]
MRPLLSTTRMRSALFSVSRSSAKTSVPFHRVYTSAVESEDPDIKVVNEWLPTLSGRKATVDAVIDPSWANLLSATIAESPSEHSGLSQPPPLHPRSFKKGDVLPPFWHLIYFHRPTTREQISNDGHELLFSPPSPPFVRRMWAGGSISWNPWYPLTIGQSAQLELSLSKLETKVGRKSGRMVLVSESREHITNANWSVRERRDVVYLKGPGAGSASNDSSVGGSNQAQASEDKPFDFSRSLVPDRIMLFRFSALTFNSHRIHFDLPYVQHEGHSDLLVHGPLISLLLLELCSRHVPTRTITKWNYRAYSPFYVDKPLQLRGKLIDDPKGAGFAELWAVDDQGNVGMRGIVGFG